MIVLLVRLAVNVVHVFFFFNDTATTEIYTLSLHDALPIYRRHRPRLRGRDRRGGGRRAGRSEEHTSELQSRGHLVCRLLLEKNKKRQHEVRLTKKRKVKKQYSASRQNH